MSDTVAVDYDILQKKYLFILAMPVQSLRCAHIQLIGIDHRKVKLSLLVLDSVINE